MFTSAHLTFTEDSCLRLGPSRSVHHWLFVNVLNLQKGAETQSSAVLELPTFSVLPGQLTYILPPVYQAAVIEQPSKLPWFLPGCCNQGPLDHVSKLYSIAASCLTTVLLLFLRSKYAMEKICCEAPMLFCFLVKSKLT